MNKKECAEYVCGFCENGGELLRRHLEAYDGETLLHIFVPEMVYYPLRECIKSKDEAGVKKYCGCIERLWEEGDEEVWNAVDVSVLECLTDNDDIWQAFGRHISGDFKNYINNEYIPEKSRWLKINKIE